MEGTDEGPKGKKRGLLVFMDFLFSVKKLKVTLVARIALGSGSVCPSGSEEGAGVRPPGSTQSFREQGPEVRCKIPSPQKVLVPADPKVSRDCCDYGVGLRSTNFERLFREVRDTVILGPMLQKTFRLWGGGLQIDIYLF